MAEHRYVKIKRWDSVNQQLTLRLYKVGESMITLTEFATPILIERKGAERRLRRTGRFYYGQDFIKELHRISLEMTLPEALAEARKYAMTNRYKSIYAANALAYIDTIELAEQLGADKTHLLYILGNLQGWHGEIAREAKKVMKEASKMV